MARLFKSGTVSSGEASQLECAKKVEEEIHAAIIEHSAWELVETLEPSGRKQRVYKLKKASSGLPKDVYFIMDRVTTSNGGFKFAGGEDYNTGTHVLTAMRGNESSTIAIDSEGKPTASIPTLTLNKSSLENSNTASVLEATLGASAFWAVIADNDGISICAGTTTSSSFGFYFGAFTSCVAASIKDALPLCFMNYKDSSINSSSSSTSRHVGIASPAPERSFLLRGVESSECMITPDAYGTAFNENIDVLQGGKIFGYTVGLFHGEGGETPRKTKGFFRGILKRTMGFKAAPSGWQLGDKITAEGHTWLFMSQLIAVDTGA